jgi:DNA-binding PadR family transcriptional regulator
MMRSEQADPENLLPLTPAVFNILLALADGERHGYSIMQEISSQTQGRLRIGPTTLYRSIKHMLEGGLITESDERPDPALDDERRRYYRLTTLGQRVAAAEVKRLEQTLAVAHSKPLLQNSDQTIAMKGV